MARNPYVGQRCSGRQAVTLMREINAIEHVLEQTISHLDVYIHDTVLRVTAVETQAIPY